MTNTHYILCIKIDELPIDVRSSLFDVAFLKLISARPKIESLSFDCWRKILWVYTKGGKNVFVEKFHIILV